MGLLFPESLILRVIGTEGLSFPQVPVLVVAPFPEYVRAWSEPILASQHFRGDPVLVWAIGVGTVQEQGEHDVSVAVRGGEMQGGRS